MERQFGQRCPPSNLEGRRQAQRLQGSHSVQGLGYWSGQDSEMVPLPLGTRSARKSRGEARGGRELFRGTSTAALGYEAKLLRQARHQWRLDAWLGSPRRRRRTPEAHDCGVLLLERAGLPHRRTLLVRFGGEERVVSFGTVAVPTLSSTEATLTPFEASVGNAACL